MTLDGEMVKALEEDYTTAPITEQDRVMLDYVVQITKDATRPSITNGCVPSVSTTKAFCRSL